MINFDGQNPNLMGKHKTCTPNMLDTVQIVNSNLRINLHLHVTTCAKKHNFEFVENYLEIYMKIDLFGNNFFFN
jgi:hypothetical protein